MAIRHRFLRIPPHMLSKTFPETGFQGAAGIFSPACIFLIFGCPVDKMNFSRVPKWWNMVDTPS